MISTLQSAHITGEDIDRDEVKASFELKLILFNFSLKYKNKLVDFCCCYLSVGELFVEQ